MPIERKIAIIGLGYVGLTIAVAFGKKSKVIGYDLDKTRLNELKQGRDWNHEISPETLKSVEIFYTNDAQDLKQADFYIVTVPTPLSKTKHPDLSILLSATKTISQFLKKGDIVVFESTVYPGATEEECIPVLEKGSTLQCGKDFGVGYSPERINPGDKIHTFENICKIVSGINQSTLEIISQVYEQVITGGIHQTSNIKIAEAAKVIENTQRDLNISLMNEIAYILHHCDMNLEEVLAATKTKWNALPYRPGLVGGHCIGINSYYLADKAQAVGYYPNIILSAQRVNSDMVEFLANETIKNLIHLNIPVKEAKIAVLGVTYKEDYPDFHDSKVFDLIRALQNYEATVIAHDPIINHELAKKECPVAFIKWEELTQLDALILCVGHKAFQKINQSTLAKMLNPHAFVMDVKGILDSSIMSNSTMTVWRM